MHHYISMFHRRYHRYNLYQRILTSDSSESSHMIATELLNKSTSQLSIFTATETYTSSGSQFSNTVLPHF
ncbi:BPG_G0018140.mRNA.1.CDS.1 [Saccharomyces cerevisiae]|nr:BPG_G0018140.mRNA.1.CDS.1 [Saccharomyces cerevisiae]CAI7114687.1 BPG_G0018140.mRNA.1.CDS.1 [Saccharomyces cerevisiae]